MENQTDQTMYENTDDYIITIKERPIKNWRYYQKRARKLVWEIISWSVLITGFIATSALLVTQHVLVAGHSMNPTIHDGAQVLINKSLYVLERGDIIVTRPKQREETNMMKRVIAVGGDVIRFNNSELYLNDEKLNEPYLSEPMVDVPDQTITIPDGHVWLMGDNRNHSTDSRDFGPVAVEDIDGQAIHINNEKKAKINAHNKGDND